MNLGGCYSFTLTGFGVQKVVKENGPDTSVDELTKAKEAVAEARKAYREIA